MSIRVAQISDIHARPGGQSLAALARALEWLALAKPDVLIVSGDVGNPPWEESYPLVREALGAVACPILMVPGNKDDRRALRNHFPAMPWLADEHLSTAMRIGALRIVGLDVTVPGETFGDAAPILGWLGDQLTGGEPVVLFMHQHPFPTGFDRLDKAMCRNADALAQVIFEAPARVMLIAAGHGHRPVFTEFIDIPAVMCPSLSKANVLEFGDATAPPFDPPGLLLHIVEENRVMSHLVALG
ncbi:MAG TPA: hypothetical protein GYA10_07220 [Alphaproteobacteria bacterium]|nr:hypothetical protein [Alphaproteobacteria bacterium]